MDSPDVVERVGGRVFLVNEAGQVLLFRMLDQARPGRRYWITPGGGLEPGETSAQGAARELYEETGLLVAPSELGAPVWRDAVEFPFEGQQHRQRQEYFFVSVPSWHVQPAAMSDFERRNVLGHRWWSLDDLTASTETYYPLRLPDLIRPLIAPEDAP